MATSPTSGNRKVKSISQSQVQLADVLESWERSLQARNLAPLTIIDYTKRVQRFVRWLEAEKRSTLLGDVTKATIQDYLATSLASGAAPKSVEDYHGALKVFFGWCLDEGEITLSPMDRVPSPMVPRNPPPLLRDEELANLLQTCEAPGANTFMDRRDAAILRLFIDTGIRLAELTGLKVNDVDMQRSEVKVHGKGRRDRTVAIHRKTWLALDRYTRIRSRHTDAGKLDLWLGAQGPLSDAGIYRIVKQRAIMAGISPAKVHPHSFRHNWADQWLEEGGQEHAGAKLAGWTNTDQFKRYGAAREEERAREAAKKMQGADRL